MQLSIEHIEKEMSAVELSPRQLGTFRVFLAAMYSLYGAQMKQIEVRKARAWLDIRATARSTAEADRAWDTTPDGISQIELKWELRRIEKLTAAVASMLRVMETEARNVA